MDKHQAQNIIRETFESAFDKEKFTGFIKNLLKHIEESAFTYQGQFISDAYKAYISSLERIGKFNDGENRIDILIVKLQKETSLERARTMQRNFVAWYLNGSRGGELKDAALVAFVSPDEKDWRFSLVKMDYKFEQTQTGRMRVKEEFTPARRWSFLVGANENSHTAQSRLVHILANDDHSPTLTELEQAFDIETVTKEFFIKYRGLFIRTKEELDKIVETGFKPVSTSLKNEFESKGVDTVNFAKKLLGQIIFLYFLQKKGWFGVGRDAEWGTGSKHFLRELFEKKHSGYKNFFNDILEPLFYDALRNDRSHDDHYYSQFNCKIPFLNGGLFDPIGNNGGYNWVHTDICLPDSLFSNNNKTKEGDEGDGILDIFDRYNFTVREDEPLEREVAIDPELLGKAYEKFNAIRPDNFEEYKKALKSGKKGDESKFNKQYGVYYTPREIVHYMCQQSLINYLHTELIDSNHPNPDRVPNPVRVKVSKEDIETLIHLGEQVSENEEIALIKEQKILEGKQKSSDYKLKLPESIRKNAALIDQKLADITVCDPAVGSGAFPVGMMSEIVKARNTLSVFVTQASLSASPETLTGFRTLSGLKSDTPRTTYDFKRQCIEKSLYGVDVDPGAVEIAKLRLWLSLVVDEDDIKNIKPLPNLDYKIVCGNSLLGVEKNLFNSHLFSKLEKIKPLYFNETNPTKKQDYKKQIDELISQITNGHKEFDFEIYFSEVFHHKGGFDVVIANPPYVQLQKLKDSSLQRIYIGQNYKVYNSNGDIYCLFYERGFNLLAQTGVLTFITSNKWMRANYGKTLRKFFITNGRIAQLIDFGDSPILENATTYTNILILYKNNNGQQTKVWDLSRTYESDITLENMLSQEGLCNPLFAEGSFVIAKGRQTKIKERLNKIGTPLKGWDIQINYGIKTGFNEAFIISGTKKDELIAKDPKSAEIIKPILRGRDIKRYKAEFADLWLINSHNGFGNIPRINVQNDYPAIWEHLKRINIESGGKVESRYDQGGHWTNLRNCAYIPEFEKEKIVYAEIVFDSAFFYDSLGYYPEATSFIITGDSLKYLTALLNSKLLTYAFKTFYAGGDLRGNTFRYKKAFLENLPIPKLSDEAQKPFITLVDQILTAKQKDPQADTSELEKHIDQLVYQLYGLTEEEIKIVENINS